MSPELEERIYQSVLRAVLWGTERDEIFVMLQANEITGDRAEELFRRAWSERIEVLRSEGVRRAMQGALVFAAGSALYCVFWFGFGGITRLLFVICGLLGIWGIGWFLQGIFNALFASKKTGSVITED